MAGPVDETAICSAEDELQVQFPPDRGDYMYYLDTDKLTAERECPVVVLGPGSEGVVIAKDFFDFVVRAYVRQSLLLDIKEDERVRQSQPDLCPWPNLKHRPHSRWRPNIDAGRLDFASAR